MKIGIYEGVDSLVTAILKRTHKNDLNTFLEESFPNLFGTGNISFLQHLFTVPLPLRANFTFILLYGQSNTGIPLLDKEIILAFGMIDGSKKGEYLLKNLCRKKGIEWKGVGKHILKALDRYAITNGIHVVSLVAENDNLIKYYTKLGWTLREDIRKKYMIKSFK